MIFCACSSSSRRDTDEEVYQPPVFETNLNAVCGESSSDDGDDGEDYSNSTSYQFVVKPSQITGIPEGLPESEFTVADGVEVGKQLHYCFVLADFDQLSFPHLNTNTVHRSHFSGLIVPISATAYSRLNGTGP